MQGFFASLRMTGLAFFSAGGADIAFYAGDR
jgi:hypothetical protein